MSPAYIPAVLDDVRHLLARDPRIGYALAFGSFARGTQHALSDLDIAIGGSSARFTAREIGDLVARLEAASGQNVDLVLLDAAPPGLAFRVFRDGKILVEDDPAALTSRRARAALEYLDWKPVEELFAIGGSEGLRGRQSLAAKALADIRDAVARIRDVLPASEAEFVRDRTTREVVVLNLFVALQHSLSVTAHWLAEARLDVPAAYRDAFVALGDRGVLPRDLAERLASASGLRNLIAHRYGVIDAHRIYEIASTQLDDLLAFCAAIERAIDAG